MSETESPARGFRVHPLDLLVLVMAVGLAALAYAYLFNRSPVPRVVDRYLGAEIEVEFEADREWKRTFLAVETSAEVEDYLVTDVMTREPLSWEGRPRIRAKLKVRDRHDQKPETMTLFRTEIRRGISVRLSQGGSEVIAEVVAVHLVDEGGDEAE